MANSGINFFIVINRFSLVKAAMNTLRVCKLRKNCLTVIDQCAMVLKKPQFLHFQLRKAEHRPLRSCQLRRGRVFEA